MDIKAKAEEIVAKIRSDKDLKAKFAKDPEKTIEGLLGIDIPDGAADKVLGIVKAKLGAADAADIVGKIGGIFGKK